MRGLKQTSGFTFIEVLVAMLIFVLAVLGAVNIAQGSVRASAEAKDIAMATWLLQGLMADLETKLETEGIDRACEAEKKGQFEEPYERYSWATYCHQIDFKLSEQAAAMAKQLAGEEAEAVEENPIAKMILDLAGKYISDASRELHVEVFWNDGRTNRDVTATTHFVRYDLQPQVPALGGFGGAGGAATGDSSDPGGGTP